MTEWKTYIFSMILCSIICSVVTQIVQDSQRKGLIRVVCGTVTAIFLLHPFADADLSDYRHLFAIPQNSADYYIAEGEKHSAEARRQFIMDSCEAYILDKAKSLGCEIVVRIELNDDFVPVFAEILGAIDSVAQNELAGILSTDLGIPKENQQWIWNRERNS